jgi:hypothetical protein
MQNTIPAVRAHVTGNTRVYTHLIFNGAGDWSRFDFTLSRWYTQGSRCWMANGNHMVFTWIMFMVFDLKCVTQEILSPIRDRFRVEKHKHLF